MARAWQEGHEEHTALRRQKHPPPQAFFRLYDEEDAEGKVRPGSVTDPRPQERVQRRLAGLQGFPPRQSSAAPTVAQISDIPARGGGPQGFHPGQSSSASSSSPAGVHGYADEPGVGFFRTFP